MSSKKNKPAKESSATIGFEAKLWLAADKLRNNMDASEYKHVVLGKEHADTFRTVQHLQPPLRNAGYVLTNRLFNDSVKALTACAFVPEKSSMPKVRQMKGSNSDLEMPNEELRILNCFSHFVLVKLR